MKKFNLLAITVLLLLAQGRIFGSDLLKTGTSSGDSIAKCPGITVEVKDIEAAKALVIKATIKTSEISAKTGELFSKLIGYMQENGIQMTGPPFTKYYSWDPEGETEMEAGAPVEQVVETQGEIQYVELPAVKVATALHTGPYEAVGPVYEAIEKFIEKEGLRVAGAVWEVYLTDPNTEPDPNKYKTQVYFPVE